MLNEEQRAQLVEASKSLSLVEEPPSDTLRVDATTGTESGGEVVEDVKLEKSVNGYPNPKNIVEEAESYKTQLSSLEQKLANLEQSKIEPPVQQAQVEDNNWLDDFLAEDTETQTPDWQGKYQGLDKRLYKFEVAQEEKSLKAELGSIKEQYPGVPEQFLLQAVIKDPNVDMTKIAGDYHSFISGIEEQAIARYSEGQAVSVETVPAPEAPPRPKSVGTSPAKVMAKPDKRPSTIEEASASLRNLLKKDNPFR